MEKFQDWCFAREYSSAKLSPRVTGKMKKASSCAGTKPADAKGDTGLVPPVGA
jgi:hypothetical protein